MKRIARLREVVFIIALTLVVGTGFIPSTVFAQQDKNNEPVSSIVAASSAEVQAYWTEERMRNAIPMPMPEITTPAAATGTQGGVSPSGPTVIANSGGPGDVPKEMIMQEAEGALEPLFGTYPFSYTRYRLFPNTTATYKKFPYKMTGKLFFVIPGQGNFVCSASSINSANMSVVWTAGHCVFSPGTGFHTNFVFAPARREFVNPFGTWDPKTVFTLVGWQNGLFEYDHGALVMNLGGSTIPTKKIGNAVGFLGFVANISRQQHWHLHGYPAGARDIPSTPPGAQFDGEHHEICAATWATDDQPTGTPGVDPPAIGVGCDKTGGTSGGPWVKDFSGVGGQTNLLNGNNSYRYTGPNPPANLKLFSPYFSAGAVNLRNAAQAVPVP